MIDEGATTDDTTIHLTIVPDDATSILVTGDLFHDANTFQWIPVVSELTVELTAVTGVHTVTVSFRDALGNVGGDQTATIDYQLIWGPLGGGDHDGDDWTLSDGTVVAGVHTNVGVFTVPADATVSIAPYNGVDYGAFVVNAAEVHVLGTIDGTASGYAAQAGGGAGTSGGETPCGAGYGGAGGQGKSLGGSQCTPGAPYGLAAIQTVPWSANDVAMGSGGGAAGSSAPGGRGGAKVVLSAPIVIVSGVVLADGESVSAACAVGAGGSGGGILLLGDSVTVSGALSADGGASDSDTCEPGGGGGGGRVKIRATTLDLAAATVTTAGGAGYAAGEAGTYFHPETNLPTSAITAPMDGAVVDSPPSITGTAADDTTVEVVEVRLVRDADGYSWDGAAWVVDESWLPAMGRASWWFADGPTAAAYSNGTYTVESRATDVAGNTELSPASAQFEWTGGP